MLDLAAAVHLHRAVDVVEHPRAAGRADRPQDLLPVLAGPAASIVNSRTRLPSPPAPGTRSTPCSCAAGLGDRRGQLAQRLLARVELDPDRDAVLSADGHGRYRIRFDVPARPGQGRRPHEQVRGTMNLGFLILADSSEAINGKVYALGAGWTELRRRRCRRNSPSASPRRRRPWSETSRRPAPPSTSRARRRGDRPRAARWSSRPAGPGQRRGRRPAASRLLGTSLAFSTTGPHAAVISVGEERSAAAASTSARSRRR